MDNKIKLRYGIRLFTHCHQNRINTWLEKMNKELMDFSVEQILAFNNISPMFFYSYIGKNEIEDSKIEKED